ncbi:Beta-sarcoglycan [Trichinella spiralis]|uniref:Beta-sarcoglycan n=1 Tax=Trichinella spiralis TaxID=6334 RepID=A0A0V1BXW8_TRISP|nr:Beta-sarcoglycan [Trichinella spiralis]
MKRNKKTTEEQCCSTSSTSRKDVLDTRVSDLHVEQEDLLLVGLRGRKLIALLVCVGLMWLIAIVNLVCNILLVMFLKIGNQGMDGVQFGRTVDGKPVVQFAASETYFQHMVSKTGTVGGYRDTDLNADAARIVIRTNNSTTLPVGLIIDENRIRMQNVNTFIVRERNTLNKTFDASQPILHLQKNIKKISTKLIKTKKIRAPLDNALTLDVENLSFRGNEGTLLSSRAMNIRSTQSITLKTGDRGVMNLTAGQGLFLTSAQRLPLSDSPSFRANVLGRRLCSCAGTGRLFTVAGNMPCASSLQSCI